MADDMSKGLCPAISRCEKKQGKGKSYNQNKVIVNSSSLNEILWWIWTTDFLLIAKGSGSKKYAFTKV